MAGTVAGGIVVEDNERLLLVTVRHVVLLPPADHVTNLHFHVAEQHTVVPCGTAAFDDDGEYLEATKAKIGAIVEEKAWMTENEGWKQKALEDMACAIVELAVLLVLRQRIRTLGGYG